MPSAITFDIHDGKDITLKGFIQRAAPQMFYGCSSVPTLKQLQKSYNTSYYKDRLKELRADLKRVAKMSVEEFAAAEAALVQKGELSYKKAVADALARKSNYEAVAKALEAWEPGELHGLKEMMVRLLEQDIYDYREPDPKWYRHTVRQKSECLNAINDLIKKTQKTISEEKVILDRQIESVRLIRNALKNLK